MFLQPRAFGASAISLLSLPHQFFPFIEPNHQMEPAPIVRKLKALRLFAESWLRSPRHVGAIAPSSAALARAMASQISNPGDARVVELGAGTGVTTQALLDRGISPDRLTVIERDPFFCRQLRNRFPQVRIIEGDASRLRALLGAEGRTGIDALVSSLPLLSLGPKMQLRILREALSLLPNEGCMIQFTYGVSAPVHPQVLAQLALLPERLTRIWLNLPPATVWRFRATGVIRKHEPSFLPAPISSHAPVGA